VAVICLVVWRRAVARRRAEELAAEAGGTAAGVPEAAGRGLSRAELAVFAGVPFAVFFTLGGVLQTLAPLIAADALGLGPAAIGAAIGLGGLTRVAGAFAAGRLSDTVSRKAALIPGLALTAAGCALLIPQPTLGTWVTAVVLVTFGSSGVAVAATMIADRVPAGTLGRHLGPYRFMGDAGLFAGPALGGLLAEQAGRGAAMGLAVAVLLGSAVSMRFVAEIPPQERS
jgi:MFS family permease